jgi:hypothetical protein
MLNLRKNSMCNKAISTNPAAAGMSSAMTMWEFMPCILTAAEKIASNRGQRQVWLSSPTRYSEGHGRQANHRRHSLGVRRTCRSGDAALLKRRLGQRDIGVIGGIAVVALSLALMWLVSHFVSNDTYYWFIAIAACTGISVLVSQVLFGKPRQAP